MSFNADIPRLGPDWVVKYNLKRRPSPPRRDSRGSPIKFSDLPNELLLIVVDELSAGLDIDENSTRSNSQWPAHRDLIALSSTSRYMHTWLTPIIWKRAFFRLQHDFLNYDAGPCVAPIAQHWVKKNGGLITQLYSVPRYKVPTALMDRVQKLVVPFEVFRPIEQWLDACTGMTDRSRAANTAATRAQIRRAAADWRQYCGVHLPSVQHLVVTVSNLQTIDRPYSALENEMSEWFEKRVWRWANNSWVPIVERYLDPHFYETWAVITHPSIMPSIAQVEIRRTRMTDEDLNHNLELECIAQGIRSYARGWWPYGTPVSNHTVAFERPDGGLETTTLSEVWQYLEREDEELLEILHAEINKGLPNAFF